VIVVDTSAIMAILNQEPEAEAFAAAIAATPHTVLSAASLVEASMVAVKFRRTGFDPDRWMDDFLRLSQVEIAPVTVEQAGIAREAFRRFGKGTGHGAGLNFGDCFAYALAKSLDAPLLFKGNDFSRTDVIPALGA
jgi:ribonuclease VapC